jgi:hypothetical protein
MLHESAMIVAIKYLIHDTVQKTALVGILLVSLITAALSNLITYSHGEQDAFHGIFVSSCA